MRIWGKPQQKRRAVLIVEDDAELRGLTAALLEDGELDTIECESVAAALAIMLIGGRDVHDLRGHPKKLSGHLEKLKSESQPSNQGFATTLFPDLEEIARSAS
jgi:CheY-like chemotaxis protein